MTDLTNDSVFIIKLYLLRLTTNKMPLSEQTRQLNAEPPNSRSGTSEYNVYLNLCLFFISAGHSNVFIHVSSAFTTSVTKHFRDFEMALLTSDLLCYGLCKTTGSSIMVLFLSLHLPEVVLSLILLLCDLPPSGASLCCFCSLLFR